MCKTPCMTTTETEAPVLTFLERLSIAVGRTGMGKTELAEWLELNPSSVSRWFMGDTRPRAAVLRLIAMQSGVSYEWLKPGPRDEDPASVVHPLGLEPRTHWLSASSGLAAKIDAARAVQRVKR